MSFNIGETVYQHSACRSGTVTGKVFITGSGQDWPKVRFGDEERLVHPRDLLGLTSTRIEAVTAIDGAMRTASSLYANLMPGALGQMLAAVALDVLQSFDPAQRAALFDACSHCGATTEAECQGSDLPAAYTADEKLREQRSGRGQSAFYRGRWGGP